MKIKISKILFPLGTRIIKVHRALAPYLRRNAAIYPDILKFNAVDTFFDDDELLIKNTEIHILEELSEKGTAIFAFSLDLEPSIYRLVAERLPDEAEGEEEMPSEFVEPIVEKESAFGENIKPEPIIKEGIMQKGNVTDGPMTLKPDIGNPSLT